MSAHGAHIEQKYIDVYNMSDFSKSMKCQKNKKKTSSFFFAK